VIAFVNSVVVLLTPAPWPTVSMITTLVLIGTLLLHAYAHRHE